MANTREEELERLGRATEAWREATRDAPEYVEIPVYDETVLALSLHEDGPEVSRHPIAREALGILKGYRRLMADYPDDEAVRKSLSYHLFAMAITMWDRAHTARLLQTPSDEFREALTYGTDISNGEYLAYYRVFVEMPGAAEYSASHYYESYGLDPDMQAAWGLAKLFYGVGFDKSALYWLRLARQHGEETGQSGHTFRTVVECLSGFPENPTDPLLGSAGDDKKKKPFPSEKTPGLWATMAGREVNAAELRLTRARAAKMEAETVLTELGTLKNEGGDHGDSGENEFESRIASARAAFQAAEKEISEAEKSLMLSKEAAHESAKKEKVEREAKEEEEKDRVLREKIARKERETAEKARLKKEAEVRKAREAAEKERAKKAEEAKKAREAIDVERAKRANEERLAREAKERERLRLVEVERLAEEERVRLAEGEKARIAEETRLAYEFAERLRVEDLARFEKEREDVEKKRRLTNGLCLQCGSKLGLLDKFAKRKVHARC